ncbi:MAG: hypothetical protein K8F27_09800 [Sulfuricellaceae bacterium]|nr:hypothetical protein [Sulfuricellaceae bacterium]
MKKLPLFALAFLGFLANTGIVMGYEVDTHEDLSENAATISVLGQGDVLTDLGLQPFSTNQTFPGSDNTTRTINKLFRFGANFEDNASLSRPRNHFYNPLNGQSLTVKGIALGNASPDWALEDGGNIGGQDFSLKDAREYLYKALTLSASADREKNFGLTFQTLGMVIHHIQDMAQPQHVRNDPHMDRLSLWGLNPLFNPSLYEQYTNRRDVRGSLPFTGYAPVYSTADPATFNNPRNFWTKTTGVGLAQFTNANFVSAGTNFDNPGMFNFPLFDPALRTDMDIQQLCANANPPCPNPNLTGTMAFFGNWVEDRYTGQRTLNPMASTLSIFDADLEKVQSKKLFTLNRFNFGVAHGFLIPRAVGYSAGLINYFFRGKIDFVPDPNNAGNYIIKNLGPETMSGDFTLYYDAVDGKRYPVAGDAPTKTWTGRVITASNPADPVSGYLGNLTFTPPTDPAPKTSGEYMLVFSGDMGEEKAMPGVDAGAVAAKVVVVMSGKLLITHMRNENFFYDVYQSVDGGRSWAVVGGFSDANTVNNHGMGRINALYNQVVLGANNISKDGGATWQSAPSLSLEEVILRSNATYIGNGKSISNTAGNDGFGPTRTFYSTDDGLTWVPGAIALDLIGKPVNMGQGRLFAIGAYIVGTQPCYWYPNCVSKTYKSGLYRSDNAGVTWSKAHDFNQPFEAGYLTYLGKRKLVNGVLLPDKKGSDVLFIIDWTGNRYDFRRSVDEGLTWETVGFPSEMAYGAPLYYAPWYIVYAGNRTIYAYFHNSVGYNFHFVYVSTDDGNTWRQAGDLPPGTGNTGLWDFVFVGDNGAVPGLQ